jgi:hypothetical protein
LTAELRRRLVAALVLMRNRSLLPPLDVIPLLFRMFRIPDKLLRCGDDCKGVLGSLLTLTMLVPQVYGVHGDCERYQEGECKAQEQQRERGASELHVSETQTNGFQLLFSKAARLMAQYADPPPTPPSGTVC